MKVTMIGVTLISLCISLVLMPASASDFTLQIFGNANMDDTINEQDIEYVQGIIDGTNDETELADAKYDGEINEEDIAQIELIISGEEELLTVIDSAGRIVTVPQPIERVVTTHIHPLRQVVILGAADKVVGIDSGIADAGMLQFEIHAHPEILDLPIVGTSAELNLEAIVDLKPDVIFSFDSDPELAEVTQKKTGIPVVCIGYHDWRANLTNYTALRYSLMLPAGILGTEDRADWLVSYVGDKLERITKITDEIPAEEKPKVYGLISSGIKCTTIYGPIDSAGGINVAKEDLLSKGLYSAQINPEQVIIWDPDVIFLGCTGEHVAQLLEVHPGLEATTAMKEGRIYQVYGPYNGHNIIQLVVETYYMAKILHPDEFHDLDVEKEANIMFEEVYGVEDLYNKMQEARGLELYQWE